MAHFVALAGQAQSAPVSAPVAGLIKSVAAFFAGLVSDYSKMHAYTQTVNKLSSLSDDELEDIGLTRGDIREAARKSAGL